MPQTATHLARGGRPDFANLGVPPAAPQRPPGAAPSTHGSHDFALPDRPRSRGLARPPAACAARASCPASSTAATATPSRSRSTRASCATRSRTRAPSSRSSIDGSDGQRRSLVKDAAAPPGARRDACTWTCCACDMTSRSRPTVVLELTGADEAPGVIEGGVLSQETRELNIEALPGDIPDVIQHDVSDDGHQRHADALGGHRARTASRFSTIPRRPSSPRSPRRRSSRSRTRSRPRPSSSARTARPIEAPRATRAPTPRSPPAGGESRRASPEALLLRRPSTGWSSGWATRGPATRETPHNVGFEVAERAGRGAGICRSPSRSSRVS